MCLFNLFDSKEKQQNRKELIWMLLGVNAFALESWEKQGTINKPCKKYVL